MFITDAQVHIWPPSRPGREWPNIRGFVPAWANQPFLAEDLLEEMKAAGVDRVVLSPPGFAGGNDYALEATAKYPGRFGVIARMDVDGHDREAEFLSIAATPGVIGLRFPLFNPHQTKWVADGVTDWIWSLAEVNDTPLMVYPAPEAIEPFGDIAARHPRLRLTIDHLAVGFEDWRRDDRAFDHLPDLLALSAHPNVSVKASGLPEYSTEAYPYRNLHPYVEQVVEAFGPQRVFWGTDLTRLPCTYRRAVTMFTEEMTFLSEADLEWIMGRALAKWFDWPVNLRPDGESSEGPV